MIKVEVPASESRLSMYLSNAVVYEVASNPVYKKVLFIAGDNYYNGTIDFLKGKKIEASMIALGERSERRREDRGRGDNREKKNDRRNNDRRKETRDPRNQEARSQTPPYVVKPEDLQRLVDFFAQKLVIGESYKKSALGIIPRQATRRSNYQLFKSPNANVFLDTLMKNGCLTEDGPQSYKVVSYPTVDMFQFTLQAGSDKHLNEEDGPELINASRHADY